MICVTLHFSICKFLSQQFLFHKYPLPKLSLNQCCCLDFFHRWQVSHRHSRPRPLSKDFAQDTFSRQPRDVPCTQSTNSGNDVHSDGPGVGAIHGNSTHRSSTYGKCTTTAGDSITNDSDEWRSTCSKLSKGGHVTFQCAKGGGGNGEINFFFWNMKGPVASFFLFLKDYDP